MPVRRMPTAISEQFVECLLELTEGGRRPVTLPTGEERRFLEDGDEVILRGFCEAPGFRRISLGECTGVIGSASA